jgi:hypothetical protein
LQFHFFPGRSQAIIHPKLAGALAAHLQLFLVGEGVVLVLVHEKGYVEEIIVNE